MKKFLKEMYKKSPDKMKESKIWIFFMKIALFFIRLSMGHKYLKYKRKAVRKWLFTSKEHTNFTYKLTEKNIQYLVHMIAVVLDKDFNSVYSYLEEALNDRELSDFIINKTKNSKFAYKADFRADFGRRLGWYCFARIMRPKVVIETGIDKGLGSVLLCSALKKNSEEGYSGRYYGTDINKDAGYLLDGVYKNFGEILYGDSIESLKKFDKKIDLFINDSDHSADYEYDEYLTIKDKLSEQAIILGDNCDATDKLSLFSKENGRCFLFFEDQPLNHWFEGSGIGISYRK